MSCGTGNMVILFPRGAEKDEVNGKINTQHEKKVLKT